MPDQETIERLRQKLTDRKEDLLQRLELNEEAWSQLQEKQVELEERAENDNLAQNLEGLDEQILQELFRIEKSLHKIRNNVYGICESCGREISVKRLLAVPDTSTCRKCAARDQPHAAAGTVEIVETEAGFLPEELSGLDDEQLAERVSEYIQNDGRIPTEELNISSNRGVIRLSGYLPGEPSRELLLQILADRLGIMEIEDHLVIDRLLWEKRERTPGRKDPGKTDYEQAAEGEGRATEDATEAQKNGIPLEPADKIIPERDRKG